MVLNTAGTQCLYIATQVKRDIAVAVGLLTQVQVRPEPYLFEHAEQVLILVLCRSGSSGQSTPT